MRIGDLRAPLICGPTAAGKSALAVDLALALRADHDITAQIVTADAFQVYRGLDIGTAKPSLEDQRALPHHLIDIADPRTGALLPPAPNSPAPTLNPLNPLTPLTPPAVPPPIAYTPFTVDRWLELARRTIAELRAADILPIVVGGTHLYVKALLDGMFDGPEPDPALRARLAALSPAALRQELELADPAAARRIHPNDLRRTVRALEVFRITGVPISTLQTQWNPPASPADGDQPPPDDPFMLVTLNWPVEALNPRINARVKNMIALGLVDEARSLHDRGLLGPQAREALGYKQLIPHFQNPRATPLDDAIEQIKIETRRFAKNQRTWLRRLLARASIALDGASDPGLWARTISERLVSRA